MEPWHKIYPILANRLAVFYETHGTNTGTELYSIFNPQPMFQVEMTFGRLYSVKSVDPIHIFLSFNRANQTEQARINQINLLFERLSSVQRYNEIDFSGCPTPFPLKIGSARPLESQEEIWKLFFEIVNNKEKALNERVFTKFKNWYGVEIVSFTIFLFWVQPRFFLSLDRNTMKLLSESLITINLPRNYKEYKALLVQPDSDLYINLTNDAVKTFKTQTEREGVISQLQKDFIKKEIGGSGKFLFRLVALKPYNNIPQQFLKNLKHEDTYQFYQQYEFNKDGSVKYDPENEISLYDNGALVINISAVVGKNGSGKSTLTELFFLALNNLAYLYLGGSTKKRLKLDHEIDIDLYFHRVTFYKISLRGRTAMLAEYEHSQKHFNVAEEREMSRDDFNNFFYTIAVSYSQYSLNSLKLGRWIKSLFHKNDGYQIPLVISPMRDKGNFDINRENKLLKSRLLATILEPEEESMPNQLRKLTEERVSTHLNLKQNIRKIKELKKIRIRENKLLLNKIFDCYGISSKQTKKPFFTIACKYLIHKLNKIGNTYDEYKRFLNKQSNEVNIASIDEYLELLKTQRSHVTHKLMQTIFYLKYATFSVKDLDKKININVFADRLREISERVSTREGEIPLIELIPPPFFEVDIFLDGEINLDSLSSGELQKIYSVTSIAYHLMNLDSVADNKRLIRYPYINVLFDEVELYFHPDLQRSFINYLISYLGRIQLNKLYAINFVFITHSPFILSDILATNILLLEKGEAIPQDKLQFNSFGANIHELLRHTFFLQHGSIGSFAEEQIDYATHFINKNIKTITQIDDKILAKNWSKEKVRKLISIIGDELVKAALFRLFYSSNHVSQSEVNDQIEILREIQESNNKNNNNQ